MVVSLQDTIFNQQQTPPGGSLSGADTGRIKQTMIKNDWTDTIDTLRAKVKAMDELNAALLEDNARLEKLCHKYEIIVSRLTATGWPERLGPDRD
jgi:hypothetical protein